MDVQASNDVFFQQTVLLPVELPVTSYSELAGSVAPLPLWPSAKVVIWSFLGFSSVFLAYCGLCHMAKLTTRSKGFVMNLCQVMVSETQAIIAAIAGVKIVFQTWSDVVFAKSALTNWYAMVFVGYLLYDMIIMVATDVRVGKTWSQICRNQCSIYCHHIFFTLLGPPVVLSLREGKADNIIGCFLTMEIPVIFLHFQHVLSLFGQTGTRPYLVNGLLTLITYFFFRIMIFPFMFYRLALRKGVAFLQIHRHISKFCAMGSLACFAMQVYWFGLLIRKALRVTRKTKTAIDTGAREKSI